MGRREWRLLLILLFQISSTSNMNQKLKSTFDLFPSISNLADPQPSLKMITSFNNYPPPFYDHVDPPSLEGHIPLDPGSPKKKNHLMKTAQNTQKKKKSGCTCKKTFCLKMYCECFSSNRSCGEDCACLSCKNSSSHL